jgi:hypothetical protein
MWGWKRIRFAGSICPSAPKHEKKRKREEKTPFTP